MDWPVSLDSVDDCSRQMTVRSVSGYEPRRCPGSGLVVSHWACWTASLLLVGRRPLPIRPLPPRQS